MYALLTPEAQQRVPLERFAAAYRDAARTSTLVRVVAGPAAEPARRRASACRCALRTRIFGTLRGQLALPVVEQDDGAAIDWQPQPRPSRACAAASG